MVIDVWNQGVKFPEEEEETEARNARLEAEVASLKAEVASLKVFLDVQTWRADNNTGLTRAIAAETEIVRLREALYAIQRVTERTTFTVQQGDAVVDPRAYAHEVARKTLEV